ncbi:MAG TPA: tRNA dihydrouridine(20/20a) synthase DusA [Burkholderiaceae bacterium]|jgi:tRNA-dihydrouridine synthase A|nr:tRNA dihydrouridine(20/20a) synthase DusA [Burkholderiaceae bacterium]
MSPHRFCVAPMLDHTDRHCRYFHRQLSRHARLYTEMVTTGALLHGPRERLLRFDEAEHPVALQLGGSEPEELAQAARFGERAGYDEIDLNCGCPSERVQRGSFGACLMAEPTLVADCVRAMRDAVSIPVTVKHRIGLDRVEDYGFVRDFVGIVSQAGCEVFIVHARNAWLKGLSPRENRTVPPLRYETVARLKRDFPRLTIVLNGGLRDHATALAQLSQVDGVMIGREACDNPWMLAEVDVRYFGQPSPCATRETVVDAMRPYLAREVAAGVPARAVVRPMIGLFNGLPGARNWRRALSDPSLLESAGPRILDRALQAMRAPSGAPRARTEEFQ